ncbi:MAG TPA: hypothetical protein VFP93_03225 [Gammaproteobacteria bacterium]|nr:hypothetical protein [Gammaproteobacteria bacterium]
MHFLTFLVLSILQVLCLIHAMKRGYNFSYILAILMFPLVGSIVHFYLSIVPACIHAVKHLISPWKGQPPLKDKVLMYRKLVEKVPSFENKYQLIVALLATQNAFEALEHIQLIQVGMHKNCPNLLQCKAKAQLLLNQKQAAFETVKALMKIDPLQKNKAICILFAQILEANGHYEAALGEYEKALENRYCFESHYYYIRLLKRLNYKHRAKDEATKLVIRYKKLKHTQKRQLRKWVILTHQLN